MRKVQSALIFLSVTAFLKLHSSSESKLMLIPSCSKLESVNLFTAVGQRDDYSSGFMSLERIRAVQRRGIREVLNNNIYAIIPGINFSHAVAIFIAGHLKQSGMEIISYRYGGAAETDPIVKLGELQSRLKGTQHNNSTNTRSPLPCPFKKEIFWDTINHLNLVVSWD